MKKSIKVVLIMLLVIGIVGCGKKKDEPIKEEDIPIVNTEEGVTEDKNLENGIVAKNTNIVTLHGETTITTRITNNGESEIYIKYLDIILKDENDVEIRKLIGYVGKKLKVKENYDITTSINIDLSKIKKVEYNINY